MRQVIDFVLTITTSLVGATSLRFENISKRLLASERSSILNFEFAGTSLKYGEDTTVLNFELREYDRFNPQYKIVMDFMELYSYADIFRPGTVVEPVVTVDVIDTGPQVGEFEQDADAPKPTIDII